MEQVKTVKGLINGIKKDGYTLFLGVPYAKPPIGLLRWCAPQELDPWEGIMAELSHFLYQMGSCLGRLSHLRFFNL